MKELIKILLLLLLSDVQKETTVELSDIYAVAEQEPIYETEKLERTEPFSVTFVGDSRTVGMQMTNPDSKYVCECGKAYQWLISEEVTKQIEENPSDIYVFNLGVNDFSNPTLYADYINAFQEEHPEQYVYYMSVNPIDDEKAGRYGYLARNAQVVAFNEKLQALLPAAMWIDTYEYLAEQGYETQDGIHYTKQTYERIYEYVFDEIERRQNEL